jgi:hypothetical protein
MYGQATNAKIWFATSLRGTKTNKRQKTKRNKRKSQQKQSTIARELATTTKNEVDSQVGGPPNA